MDILQYALIITVGMIAGIVNIMAAGGSFITLPCLMLVGLDAHTANGTNRVGIFIQSLAGLKQFQRQNQLPPSKELWQIILPTAVGSLLGAWLAAILPKDILKYSLLSIMLLAAAYIALKPNLFKNKADKSSALSVKDRPSARLYLLLAGIYGGFIQAGVGIILLLATCEVLRYHIIQANAIKVACTLIFTIIALVIFIYYDQINWGLGIALGLGNALGAILGIKIIHLVPPTLIRYALLVVTFLAIGSAMLK